MVEREGKWECFDIQGNRVKAYGLNSCLFISFRQILSILIDFLVGRKMVLLEIFSMALNSFFQQRKRKIILELAFTFYWTMHDFISQTGRNLESHWAFILFRAMLSELLPSSTPPTPNSIQERWLSEWDEKVEIFLGLCYECSIINAQEIEKLEKSED